MRALVSILILASCSFAQGQNTSNPFAYNPEKNGPVYKVVGARCSIGILNPKAAGIGVGSIVARDVFYREGEEINRLLDEGGWNPIELPFHLEESSETVCDNNGSPTTYILTVRRIEWP